MQKTLRLSSRDVCWFGVWDHSWMQQIPRLLSYLLFWTLMCKALKLQWNTVLFIWPLRSKVNDRNNDISGFHANMPLQERVEPPHFWPNMQFRLLTHCSHSELKQVQCVMCFRRRDDSGYTHTHTHILKHTLSHWDTHTHTHTLGM